MTDANLMRWLGLHSMEFLRDRRSFYDYTGRDVADDRALAAMSRHYWICTNADDPTRLIASHLERRGVVTVPVASWGEPFAELIAECFPDAAPAMTEAIPETGP